MKKLTQLQYEVIFLYSRGLTFKEIDTALATTSRGVYSQVVAKDKGRVTRAKTSRQINLNNYKQELNKKLDEVKIHNKHFRNSTQWIKENYVVSLKVSQRSFRQFKSL
ncbi:MAG: hypothetical protein WC149_04330 [Arcobacteraceae bacterium]